MPVVSEGVTEIGKSGFPAGSESCAGVSNIERMTKLDDLDRLLSLMIHQIRNHCMSIKGYASLLNYEDGVSEKGRKWINNISRGIGSLEGFLSEFENYRLTKKYTEEELEIGILVKNSWKTTLEIFGPELVATRLHLNIHENVKILGDRNDFRKMMFHLLKNALEASEGEGDVKVTIENGTRETGDAGKWIIEVQDSGCGMSDIELAKAGEILFSTKSSHIGCGLNLVSAVAKRMNATVKINSETGVGSIVRIAGKNHGRE